MKLQTILPLTKEKQPITYNDTMVLLGSCFVTNMAQKLEWFKFQHLVNPFGVIFQPVAIEKLVTRAINNELFTIADVFHFNEQWQCFEVHSEMNSTEQEQLVAALNVALQNLRTELTLCRYCIITLGTAWVYRHIETDTLVANCHKVPQKKFLKELLSVDEVEASLDNIFTLLRSINPTVKIITTVSPVRHLKDGFVANAQSKAHLLAGVHKVVEPRKHIYYFPSYEIMMDELRDYRFYKEDMIHPNTLAVNYIWEKFVTVWIDDSVLPIMKEVDAVQKGLAHKPFNKNSDSHKEFLKNLNNRIDLLKKTYSFMRF